MKGVLILAHGSRLDETEQTLNQIKEYVKEEFPDVPVAEAYLQFRDETLEKGLLSLMEEGVKDIKVLPYFLFSGVHIMEDIPLEIEKFRKKHEDVSITLGNTLEADKRLASVLSDRIREIL